MKAVFSTTSRGALALGLALGAWTAPARAQGVDPVTQVADNEIVVTAQRREEKLKDVPISISAVSDAKLEMAGATTVSGIANIVPNIQINQTVGAVWSPLISIRGLAPSADTSLGRDQPVGIYVDGVPISKSTGAAFDSVDLLRMEVLRGPQGTLYGKNTIGGAINLVTRKPSGEFGGQIVLDASSWNTFSERAVVDLPGIGTGGDTVLKIKVGVAGRQNGAWMRQTGTGRRFSIGDMAAGRLDALWELGRLKLSYAYDITDHRGTGVPLPISAPGSIAPGKALASLYPLIQNAIYTTRPDALATDKTGRSDFQVQGHAVTGEFAATDNLTLKTITAWRKLRTRSLSDFDGVNVDLLRFILNNDYNQFTQEVQLLGTFDDVRFTLGGFYMRDKYYVYNPRWSVRFGNNAKYDLSDRSGDNRSIAGYGQVTFSPSALDHRLELTGGLRWTRDTKKTRNLFLGYNCYAGVGSLTACPAGSGPGGPQNPFSGVFLRDAAGNPVVAGGAPALSALPDAPGGVGPYGLTGLTAERSWQRLTPEANITFKVTPDFTVYGRFATGFKSGGYNDVAASNSSFLTAFNPEKLVSYEIGLKGSFGRGLLNFTAAAYRSDYTDFQAGAFVPSLLTTNVINAEKARFQGVEIEGSFRPFQPLVINFGYGFLDAKYVKFVLPNGTDVTNSYQVPLAPRHNWQLGGTLTVPVADRMRLLASVNYSWRSKQFTSLNFDPTTDRIPYGLLDARLTLAGIQLGTRESLELSVWGRNLTDKQYWTSAINLGLFTVRQWGDPRSFGAEARLRF